MKRGGGEKRWREAAERGGGDRRWRAAAERGGGERRLKDGTSQCACKRSSSWEAAWKPPETTQAALADACFMFFCGNDGREHAMSRTQGGALEGVDGSSARQAAERRQQAAP